MSEYYKSAEVVESGLPLSIQQTGLKEKRRLKRNLDILLSGILLLVLSPLLLIIGILVKLTSRGPALFVQKRLGQYRRVFHMYKFRSMYDGSEKMEKQIGENSEPSVFFKPKRDKRTTKLGRVLRKYSLDELPQLVNVLKGDMSLVGPRPLLVHEMAEVNDERSLKRFSVKPGITGLWQVNGRSSCTDERRLELDLEYVDNWSLVLDFKILILTIPAVIYAKGAV